MVGYSLGVPWWLFSLCTMVGYLPVYHGGIPTCVPCWVYYGGYTPLVYASPPASLGTPRYPPTLRSTPHGEREAVHRR